MKAEVLLNRYVQAASDLAESVKRNIQHGKQTDGEIIAIIDDETVNKLNAFRIAANNISDLTAALESTSIKFDN